MNTKNIIEVLGQATTSTGGLKAGVWTTKGYNLIESGNLEIELHADGALINSVEVSNTVLTLKALQQVFDGSESINDFLDYTSQDYVSPQQKKTFEAGIKTEKTNPLTDSKRVLTSEEYRANCIKLGIAALTSETIEHKLLSVAPSVLTKEKLVTLVHDLQKLFISDEQFATYSVMLEKEIAEREKYRVLTEAGVMGITSHGNVKKASVALNDLQSAITAIDSNGFKLSGNPVYDANAGIMQIVFTEGEQEKLV